MKDDILLDVLLRIRDNIVAIDNNFIITYANQAFADVIGLKVSEVLGKHIWTIMPKATETIAYKEINEAMAKKETKNFEWAGVYSKRFLETSLFPSDNGLTIISRDITKRKQAEEALNDSKETLQDILNAMDDGVTLAGVDGKVFDCNEAALKQLGLTREEFIGKNVYDVVVPEDKQRAIEGALKVLKTGKTLNQVGVLRKDGSVFCAEISVTAIYDKNRKPLVFLGVTRDITERNKVEMAYKEAEEKFRGLVESTSDMIWQVDQHAVYTYVSPKIKEILGYEPEEVVGKTPFDFISECDEDKILETFLEIANKMKPFHGLENWNFHKNGSVVLLETSGVPILDEKGQLIGYRGIDRDITERKKAEEALRLSKEKFSKVFKNSPIAITITALADGAILDINESAVNLLGYSHKEAIGQNTVNLKIWANPNDRNLFTKTLSSQGFVRNHEYTLRKKDKTKFIVNLSAELMELQGQMCIVATFTDITAHKQMESQLEQYSKKLESIVEERTKQLQEKERLAAIGQTAGMVGHDLRNPLQTIISELYLAETELKEMPQGQRKATLQESLDSIGEQVGYMDKIVSDLQTFVKPVKPNAQVVKLKPLVEGLLVQTNFPNNIHTNMQIPDTLAVKADPQLLKRVLINLLTNSVQAMPQGGDLTITAQTDALGQVEITIEDTGVGIPEEVKPKIFTPLFTTKSKGQGFGLAVCKRVLEAQGGTIYFESEVGKGAKFIVILPA
jgi:PAS domain S-box-containing protein